LVIDWHAKQVTAKHVVRGTCEAGGRIKPGAQAPGTGVQETNDEPAKRATARKLQGCRPLRGLAFSLLSFPGACAPGFMLTPASQAKNRNFMLTPASQAKKCCYVITA
jgi:hypothetical protein